MRLITLPTHHLPFVRYRNSAHALQPCRKYEKKKTHHPITSADLCGILLHADFTDR